jgi:hypothetical protein
MPPNSAQTVTDLMLRNIDLPTVDPWYENGNQYLENFSVFISKFVLEVNYLSTMPSRHTGKWR